MKGIIEQEIEKYADKTGEYPKKVEVSQKEWNTLQKELKTEARKFYANKYVKENKFVAVPDEDITNFRGCKLVLNRKLSKFRIS